MRKIGQGRTAEVFDLENGRVVKLMLPGFPEKELQEELHCAQEVGQFDLPAPKCYGIVEMDGRKGLVYDLAAGESLRRHMLRTGEIEGDMARMAQAHRRILGCAYSGGKDIRKWLRWQTERSELLEDTLKKRALEVIDALPDGNALLHGDFHPDNVQFDGERVMVIDWMNLARGCPECDIARTCFLMRDSALPQDMPQAQREEFQQIRRRAAAAYLKEMGKTEEQLRPWTTAILAARTAEVPAEEETLLPRIQKLLSGEEITG